MINKSRVKERTVTGLDYQFGQGKEEEVQQRPAWEDEKRIREKVEETKSK